MIRRYVATLRRRARDYEVSFPEELKVKAVVGRDPADAARRAESALRLEVVRRVRKKEPLPEPGELEAGALLLPVEVPAKAVRVNLTLDANVLAALDEAAERCGFSRSGFVAEAVGIFIAATRHVQPARVRAVLDLPEASAADGRSVGERKRKGRAKRKG